MGSQVQARVLPPGFDQTKFDEALDALAAIVGADNISRDSSLGNLEGPAGELCYGDVWPIGNDESTDHTPSGAVRPKTVEEVQEIVKVASQYGLPLWTVSRGKNLGYGGSGGVVRGSVVLDLHRMNKIIEVSEEHAYAIVEPGVSFLELYAYIHEKGYKLWPSCPALGWGSIVGNTLERGFGYTPNGEHSEQQCGMEVVLATGEVVRTGMGALTDSPMWPLFKGGFGPSVDGLFFQSNLGIVTKIGIHMMTAPAAYAECIIQNHTSVSNPYRRSLSDLQTKPELVPKVLGPGMQGGCTSNKDMTALANEQGWGYWTGNFGIYAASAAILDAQWDLVQERILQAIPDAKVTATRHYAEPGQRLDASTLPITEIPHTGVPGIHNAAVMNLRGPGGGHLSFSPLFPTDGVDLQVWFDRVLPFTEEAGFDLFCDFHVYGRYVIGIILVIYMPATEGERVKKLFERLLEDAERNSISEYRTHINYMDRVRSQYDFGDNALGRMLSSIKGLLDPSGILSQGKSGIWSEPSAVKTIG
ncbi:hypothetical protein GE09DRAFT_1293803 [Coniochaeta sp. 2T2.1]|nr:hypothetical protein GE09DRAFT_1293803 [Coniochaeta sp. 2T2.1]